jgi:hypothetical protein
MAAGTTIRCRTLFGVLALSMVGPTMLTDAQAAFVSLNGLDRKMMSRHRVSVALVQVTRVRTDPARKRKGFLLHRWITLQVVKRLFGPAVPASGLRNVPFSPMVNSAWPVVQGKLTQRYFIMAWINGSPCGLGSTVSFGPRFGLPLSATGPKDPRVAAVKRILGVVSIGNDTKRLKALRRTFRSGPAYLSRLADTALVRLDGDHKRSLARYLRLIRLVKVSRTADPQLGWPILHDLSKFPPLGSATLFRRQKLRSLPGKKMTFWAFRKLVQQRLAVIAKASRADVNLRRLALLALSTPPSFLGKRGDRMDPHAVRTVRTCLRDRHVEVRRSAVRALLTIAHKTRRLQSKRAKRLVGQVRAARRREKSASERRLITRMIRKIWSRRKRR